MNTKFDTLSFLSACLLACTTTVLTNHLSATAQTATSNSYSAEFVNTFNEECVSEINNYFEESAAAATCQCVLDQFAEKNYSEEQVAELAGANSESGDISMELITTTLTCL